MQIRNDCLHSRKVLDFSSWEREKLKIWMAIRLFGRRAFNVVAQLHCHVHFFVESVLTAKLGCHKRTDLKLAICCQWCCGTWTYLYDINIWIIWLFPLLGHLLHSMAQCNQLSCLSKGWHRHEARSLRKDFFHLENIFTRRASQLCVNSVLHFRQWHFGRVAKASAC